MKYLRWEALDRVDSAICKGVGILLIATHNFMHLFPKPRENEFSYRSERFYELINIVLHDTGNSAQAVLSYFGHFGVQIFIYLSAYGLAKKYSNMKIEYSSFIKDRALKIYPAFILSIIAWAIIGGWIYPGFGVLGPLKVVYWNIESIILKLTLISSVVPGQQLLPVGPWWFIPFIFQFYFIFPFLLYLSRKYGSVSLLLLSVASIIVAMVGEGEVRGVNIYYTVIGHLPTLCLGIYLSLNDTNGIRVPFVMMAMAFVVFILGNLYEVFWYFNHISFLVLFLGAGNWLIPIIRRSNITSIVLTFFGGISMQLFLTNGYLREPFISWALDINNWAVTIILCMMSLLVSVAVSVGLMRVEKLLRKKLMRLGE